MDSPSGSGVLPRRLEYARDLVWELVLRDLKLRYKRSFLGIAWTLVNPLTQLLVFDFVFRVLFRVETPNYTAFLFVGIVAWNWFNGALMQSTTAILENRDLVRQPGFPSVMLPNVAVASQLIHYLLTLPILFGLLIVSGIPITPMALWMIPIIAIQYLFSLALSVYIAALHVTFRDTQYLLGIFLMLGFFMTPILYEVSIVPEAYLPIYDFNPMALLVHAYRDALLADQMPNLRALGIVTATSVVLLVHGRRVFERASIRFAEEI